MGEVDKESQDLANMALGGLSAIAELLVGINSELYS